MSTTRIQKENLVDLIEYPGYKLSSYGEVYTSTGKLVEKYLCPQENICLVYLDNGTDVIPVQLDKLIIDVYRPPFTKEDDLGAKIYHCDLDPMNCNIRNLLYIQKNLNTDFKEWERDPSYRYVLGNTYVVNEKGTVINTKTGNVLKHHTRDNGYVEVRLTRECGFATAYKVHRLVAFAFIPVPGWAFEYAQRLTVNHIDGNKQNNHKSNLEWASDKENIEHAKKHIFHDNQIPIEVKDHITGEIYTYRSMYDAKDKIHISFATIHEYISMNKNHLIKGRYQIRPLADIQQVWPVPLQKITCETKALLAFSTTENRETLFPSINYAVSSLGSGYSTRPIARRLQIPSLYMVPYKGYIFKYADDYTPWKVQESARKSFRTKITTPKGKVLIYDTPKEAARDLNLPYNPLRKRLLGAVKDSYYSGYKIEKA